MKPYAETAWGYRHAGWPGVIPLPQVSKWPPPSGYTGWAGVDPSGADIQAWIDAPEGAGNIALRLPLGVYGLDVDAYGSKDGGAALAAAEGRLEALPPTWLVTSRDDGISGIRLFRAQLPAGRRWKDEPAGRGRGIEAIHYGHRYAVVWPSVHPDTGATYRWNQEGLPSPDDLPELPAAWIEALSEPGEVRAGETAGHEETLEAVTGFPVGEPCTRTSRALENGLGRLRAAQGGAALHPAGRDSTNELVCLGHEGHSGARQALAQHFSAFIEVRNSRGEDRSKAEAEWWRLVRGAAGKLIGPARDSCDCALLAGEGLDFEMPVVADEPDGGDGGAGGLGLADVLDRRLLSAAQMRDIPPPRALIEGLLVLDSESWMIARPGAYKTFVALDMAGHVGAGRPWMGRAVIRGDVIYLVAEGAAGMGQRVRAWEQRNGEMTGVSFLPMPVQVKREDHWGALIEVARRREPVFIILDTQARITVGLNENDNSEMGQLVEALGKLRRATGACILVIHHLGRNGQDARGASAIDGAQDSELKLTKTEEHHVILETDKQRHLPEDTRIELELFPCALDGGGTSLVVGGPLSTVPGAPDWRINLTLNQAVVLDVVRDLFPEVGATKAEARTETVKRPRRTISGEQLEPMKNSAFYRAWDSLVGAEKLIKVHGTERYVLGDVDMGSA